VCVSLSHKSTDDVLNQRGTSKDDALPIMNPRQLTDDLKTQL